MKSAEGARGGEERDRDGPGGTVEIDPPVVRRAGDIGAGGGGADGAGGGGGANSRGAAGGCGTFGIGGADVGARRRGRGVSISLGSPRSLGTSENGADGGAGISSGGSRGGGGPEGLSPDAVPTCDPPLGVAPGPPVV